MRSSLACPCCEIIDVTEMINRGEFMKLSDFLTYDPIIVQCHDNPDADAIASGFGVYTYLMMHKKNVRLVYGGSFRIQKSNLLLMVSELNIPIEYVDEPGPAELLITVDCQYGEGNVTKFDAKQTAVIDHHPKAGNLPELSRVKSHLGACSTMVWEMLKEEGVDVNSDRRLSTALYYGLLTDTNNFAEISHPLDKDLRDEAIFERSLITRFRNSNLSLNELEIAGHALLGYLYNETYRYALVEAEPCDPNILGMISDLILEVDAVDTCMVYSILPFGIKISVRSCVKETKAGELAQFITENVGSGGGHLEKAGGFIQHGMLEKACESYGKQRDAGSFLLHKMNDYFENTEVLSAAACEIDLSDMLPYKKRRIPVAYVKAAEQFLPGIKISVRTLEGDLDVLIEEDTYIMIGIKGEVYPIKRDKFYHSYQPSEEPYCFAGEYAPTVRDTRDGTSISLIPYAKSCISMGESHIYAKKLNHRVKIFTEWDSEKYMLGREGDYLAVRRDDLHDIYIIEETIFESTYLPL